jgi:hypothetical protein
MPSRDKGCVFGYVDEINGNSEVSGFVPTRHELILLVEYWLRVTLEIQWWWFTTGQAGICQKRREAVAICRVKRIYDVIGKEAVEQVIDKIHAEFAQDIDPRFWNIFLPWR